MATTVRFRSGELTAPTGKQVLKTLGIWIAAGAVLGSGAWFLGSSRAAWTSAQVPVTAAVAVVYLAFPLATVLALGGTGARVLLRLTPARSRDYALGLAAGLGILAMMGGVVTLEGVATGSISRSWMELLRQLTDYSRFQAADVAALIFIAVRVCLLAGFAEELLFRGLLYGWLRSRLRVPVANGLVAVIFALTHLGGSSDLVLISLGPLLWGVVAGWLRERADSILPVIAGHILVDIGLAVEALWCFANHIHQ